MSQELIRTCRGFRCTPDTRGKSLMKEPGLPVSSGVASHTTARGHTVLEDATNVSSRKRALVRSQHGRILQRRVMLLRRGHPPNSGLTASAESTEMRVLEVIVVLQAVAD